MAPRKFSSLARSRQNFLGPGGHSGPSYRRDSPLLEGGKYWRGTRPGHFHSKGNDMQNIRLRTATDVLAAIPALLGFVPANSVVMIALTGHPRVCRAHRCHRCRCGSRLQHRT
ncbi:DUF4192 family protein [Rhodococcus sp. IEGM 1306]|uniref:DUF4192 family protein n=2 Tax=unclassified Rhodococcus (in: high G+C Gram-positive bacteria) TaxID=192944 RepID=UPI002F42F1A4